MGNDQASEQCPQEWPELQPTVAGTLNLEVAGYAMTIEFTPAQLESAYLPVLTLLARTAGLCGLSGKDSRSTGCEKGLSHQQHKQQRTQPFSRGLENRASPAAEYPRRVLAGLAGIPAGGKSVFAAVLQSLADRLIAPGVLVVVGMDGWHYPNADLDSRTITDSAGQPVSLRQRKGGPLSFDVSALIATLKQLATGADNVRLPVYDRRLHEPVPNALTITPTASIVLLEGNYILGNVPNCPQWDDVAALLSPKIFLECSPERARQRMIARHIRGGCTSGEASQKYESNDRLNTEIILSAAHSADIRLGFE